MAINASALIASTSGEPMDIYLSPDISWHAMSRATKAWRAEWFRVLGQGFSGTDTPYTGKPFLDQML